MHGFEDFLSSIESPQVIYDVGAGTGNYTEIAARLCPDSDIHLVEPDTAMNRKAQSKLEGHSNITFHQSPLEGFTPIKQADLIVCVHALYAMPDQPKRIDDLRKLLRPGGYLYLIDLGRHMNVADWRRYLFTEIRKKHGLSGALRIFWQGRQVAKQNKSILRAQENGAYWTHTEAEIASSVTAAGLEITRQESVYRGYSDLLLCRAKP
jgi:ubiquinone/menaquinone biosynthesis C-methylase UbiE